MPSRLAILFASLSILACGVSPAVAQPPDANALDRHTQRWLPTPTSAQPDARTQTMLLKQFRDFVARGDNETPLPKLSTEQLQEMERVFRDWQAQSGDSGVGNLESLPTDWIHEALEDPVTRMRAQQLLQRYARDRQMPADSTARPRLPRSADNRSLSPLTRPPTRPPDERPAQQARNSRLMPVPNGMRTPFHSPGNSPYTPSPSEHPEQVQALSELFERLMASEAFREEAQSWIKSLQQQRLPQNSRVHDATGGPATARGPSPAAVPNRARADATSLPPDARPATSRQNRPSQATRRAPTNRASRETAAPTNRARRSTTSSRTDTNRSSSRSVSNSSRPASSTLPTGRRASSSSSRPATSKPSTTDRSRERPATAKSSSRSSPTKANGELDIKSQVERYGLGRTLRGIVQKTLKEHGKGNETEFASGAKPKSNQSKSIFSWGKAKSNSTPKNNRARSSSRSPTEQAARSSTRRRSGQSSSSRNGESSAVQSMRRLGADIWKSVASAPRRTSHSSNRQSRASAAAPGYSVGWQPRQWWPLAIAALLLLGLLFLRRRLAAVATTNPIEVAWAKEVLKAGIRTRADVVRAFHRFALRRPEPVSNWWTHRYVADQLSESTPHLRSVIFELTSLYEQARYLPPDAELSAEQINRVETALQQCQSSSA